MRPFSLLCCALSLLACPLLRGAEVIFSTDGKRVFFDAPLGDAIGYFDLGDRAGTKPSVRLLDVAKAGGPKTIQGLAISKKGHLLIAAPDAIWAFDPVATKAVRVAALPAGFNAEDLAYQETTGAILVWGSFLREDRTVDHFAAYRIARDSDKPEPVLTAGIDSFQTAAFDSAGHIYFGSRPDLWGGVVIATEHEATSDYAWQLRAFRLAPLGTPITGEGANAQIIHYIATGGGRLTLTMRGDEGGTILRLPAPLPKLEDGDVDRVLGLVDRWAFQRKVVSSTQLATAANALPRIPIVAVSGDGNRLVYQTGSTGVRRWWLMEKNAKPRVLLEESD